MANVVLGEKKKFSLGTGLFKGFFVKAFCWSQVFLYFFVLFFMFNGNAPLIYCFEFLLYIVLNSLYTQHSSNFKV